MDISLATRKTPKSTQAAVEKPCVKPYQGTSTAAARKVSKNRRILVQIKGAPAVAGDAELGAEGEDGMAIGGSTGWPIKPTKHSTVPHSGGSVRGFCDARRGASAFGPAQVPSKIASGDFLRRPSWASGPPARAAHAGRGGPVPFSADDLTSPRSGSQRSRRTSGGPPDLAHCVARGVAWRSVHP